MSDLDASKLTYKFNYLINAFDATYFFQRTEKNVWQSHFFQETVLLIFQELTFSNKMSVNSTTNSKCSKISKLSTVFEF